MPRCLRATIRGGVARTLHAPDGAVVKREKDRLSHDQDCQANVTGALRPRCAYAAGVVVVVKFADGTLYRLDLDPQAPQGRTITPIAGAAVPLGSRMIVDGKRLVIADENGLSVVELSADASHGTVVTRMRDPSFHDTTAVARVGDRYLVVNTAWNDPPPYTISSVPVLP
jgi:hypothetical protein